MLPWQNRYFFNVIIAFCLSLFHIFITFFPDNIPLDLTGRLQVLESGDLLIAAVRESDAGKYTCIRANEAGQVEGTGYLSVLVRTQIIQPPVDTRVLLGNTATLQCKVSSDPSVPYQVDWFHNGQ